MKDTKVQENGKVRKIPENLFLSLDANEQKKFHTTGEVSRQDAIDLKHKVCYAAGLTRPPFSFLTMVAEAPRLFVNETLFLMEN